MNRRSNYTSTAQFNYRPVELKQTTQKECLDKHKVKITIKKVSYECSSTTQSIKEVWLPPNATMGMS